MEIHRVQETSVDVYLVVQRRPLSEKALLWQLLARLVYWAIGWSSDYGVEYQGVYTDEAEARRAASPDGWSYTQIPLNGSLPDQTSQYGVHDFPASEASHEYRNRKLGFTAVPTWQLALMNDKLNETDNCLDGQCAEVR